jgi:hypothetical protein
MQLLGCPPVYAARVRNRFDFSKAEARIVASKPGSHKKPEKDDQELYGLERLRAAVASLNVRLRSQANIVLESCSGSVGRVNDTAWLCSFHQAAKGRRAKPPKSYNGTTLPTTSIVYPSRSDVVNSVLGESVRCVQSLRQAGFDLAFLLGCLEHWLPLGCEVERPAGVRRS